MRTLLTSLSPVMGATFFVQGSNAAITTMIALLIAGSGGSQSDVALIAACYSLGFLAGCFLALLDVLHDLAPGLGVRRGRSHEKCQDQRTKSEWKCMPIGFLPGVG